ncbi:MAG: hypothetical protein JWM11_1788, partial [Planctomycetaceae bacterium]|nr:hypothetical protein [Planctomycetaceae bacterium]
MHSPECLEERTLLSASSSLAFNHWTINADVDPANPSETIIVEQDPADTSKIQVTINGTVFAEQTAKRVRSITVNAGAGDDTVQIALPASLNRISIAIYGGDGNDTLEAGSGRTTLHGGKGDDILTGGTNNDKLYGDDGSDILNGLGGNDSLSGGNGSDTLRGGGGVNNLSGGKGKDWLYSNPGADKVSGVSSDQVISNKTDLQQFQSDSDFQNWLAHAAAENIRLNLGGFSGGLQLDSRTTVEGMAPASNAPVASAAGSTDFSTTNTQVAGVGEQDIIETDGNYVYTISGNELVIVDVRLPESANVVSRTQLSGWGSEMYLDGDQLTVISTVNDWTGWGPIMPLGAATTVSGAAAPAITGDFMMRPIFWHPKTEVVTYDISDPTKPTVEEDTTIDGSVNASRSIDGRIYLVLNNYLNLPQPEWTYVPAANPDDYGTWVEESMDQYQARLASFDFNSIIPTYTTKSFDASGVETDTSGKLLHGTDVWTPTDPLTNNDILTVAMIDIHHGAAGIDSTTSIFGVNGDVYASTTALYVAAQDWSNVTWDGSGDQSAKTDVFKFDLTPDGSNYVASGTVDGTIIDQFSMDESGGCFHIATTSSMWQNQQSNNVFVVQQQGDSLTTVSSLTGLSPTERIQSARYVGSQLYLSTFRNVDPLLSLDLSDPLNPVVAGQLEVPGFSSYLQAWGDHDLISIGQDADPTTGVVTGMQLSMFDISDPEHPMLVGTYKIGIKAWDSYSQALWDHHAFSLFNQAGILSIPVSHWDDTNGYSSDLDVFQLDPTTGFQLLGQINHGSEVERSLMLGDNLV